MRYIIAMLVSWCLCVPNALALCSWKDAACLAPFVLSGYDPGIDSVREWSSYRGITYGYDNRIITRVRFDQEAVNVLRNNNDFGLEIELSLKGPNRNIPIDRIETTFPSNAQAGRDTTIFDSLSNSDDVTNVAVHILNPSAIEPEVDYFVYFVFKNTLPSDGVLVSTVNLQITLDFGNALNKSSSLEFLLINLVLIESNSFFDQFQYSVLETDTHKPFTAYPTGTVSGFSGVCWTSKEGSEACWINQCIGSVDKKESIWSQFALEILGVTDAHAEITGCVPGGGVVAPIRTGSGGGDGGGSTPPPSTSLPDLEIEEITVHRTPEEGDSTRLTEETSLMNVEQTYQANIWPVSKKENCQNGNTTGNNDFEVKTDVYYKYARSEDEGEWKLLKRSETHCKYMDEDDSKKEMITFTVPVDAAGKRFYVKAKVDATDGIAETDNGNNWSDVEWYPIQGACDLVISSGNLTKARLTLSQGEPYGFGTTVLNLGPDSCPSDTRLSYFYKKPGDTDWRYADGDDTPAFKLLPNQSNEEWMTEDTLVADIPGSYQARVCADTNSANQETNEANNCFDFSYTVLVWKPDFIVSALWLAEGTTIKSGTRVHPHCVVKNIGNATPTKDMRLAYYINSNQYRDDDNVEANEMCVGCEQHEQVNNDNIKLGDRGTRSLMCCADYTGAVSELNEGNNCATIYFTVKK